MEDLLPLFWIVFLAATLLFVFAMQKHQSKALDETYRNLARRLGGQAIQGGWFGRPRLTFHHHGASVLVDVYNTGGKSSTYYTQVHLPWPDRKTRCEIYPERFTSRLGKMMGMIDLEVGSPDFDRDFVITGNHRDVRDLITPEVQRDIRRLYDLKKNNDVYVAIANGRLLVKKLGLIRDEKTLHQLIDASLDLYDRTMACEGKGIEIISSFAASETEVVCQICGEPITEEPVRCRRCKTPHHEDCWQYFGGCSTFACGGRRYSM